ncbi:MAG: PilZ domain-containing protein [Thermodesulfobacteriota bacterium]|nr:PilZ domain-containing protein [Thermodesulfobacteriota bacterium]
MILLLPVKTNKEVQTLDSNLESRNNTRFEYESPVKCKDLKTGRTDDAIMYNYSSEGLYFETDLELHPGNELDLGIINSPYSSNSNAYQCYCAKVIRRDKLPDDFSRFYFGYGVKFMRNFDERRKDLINGIIIRKHQRKKSSKPINFTTNNRFYTGLIKDISKTGIFIATKDSFPSGQMLMLAIPFSNKNKNTIVNGEVVRAVQEGVGVKFKSMVNN